MPNHPPTPRNNPSETKRQATNGMIPRQGVQPRLRSVHQAAPHRQHDRRSTVSGLSSRSMHKAARPNHRREKVLLPVARLDFLRVGKLSVTGRDRSGNPERIAMEPDARRALSILLPAFVAAADRIRESPLPAAARASARKLPPRCTGSRPAGASRELPVATRRRSPAFPPAVRRSFRYPVDGGRTLRLSRPMPPASSGRAPGIPAPSAPRRNPVPSPVCAGNPASRHSGRDRGPGGWPPAGPPS